MSIDWVEVSKAYKTHRNSLFAPQSTRNIGVNWAALALVAHIQAALEYNNCLEYERVQVHGDNTYYVMVVPQEPVLTAFSGDEHAEMKLMEWYYNNPHGDIYIHSMSMGVFHKCKKVAYNVYPPYLWISTGGL